MFCLIKTLINSSKKSMSSKLRTVKAEFLQLKITFFKSWILPFLNIVEYVKFFNFCNGFFKFEFSEMSTLSYYSLLKTSFSFLLSIFTHILLFFKVESVICY